MNAKWMAWLVATWLAYGSVGFAAEGSPNSVARTDYWSEVLGGPEFPWIEHYFETDKASYLPGEQVRIVRRISNVGTVPRTWESAVTPGMDVFILHEEELLWCFNRGIMQAFSEFTLAPGEVYERHYTWDMTDMDGALIAPGVYEVRAVGAARLSVPITIVPEPSACLLLIVFPALLLRRRY